MDPLLPSCYYGESRSLIYELESRLAHSGPIFKNDNKDELRNWLRMDEVIK